MLLMYKQSSSTLFHNSQLLKQHIFSQSSNPNPNPSCTGGSGSSHLPMMAFLKTTNNHGNHDLDVHLASGEPGVNSKCPKMRPESDCCQDRLAHCCLVPGFHARLPQTDGGLMCLQEPARLPHYFLERLVWLWPS